MNKQINAGAQLTGIGLLAALTSDYLTASGVAFASVGGLLAGRLLETLFSKRALAAREILISELRLGAKTEFDVDPEEAVAIVFRFFRAATEGTARLNLGLMAAFIAGQTRKDDVRSDLFMTWADVIASLRRGEVHLLGAAQAALAKSGNDPDIYEEVHRTMLEAGYSHIDTYSMFTSLTRTGCFSIAPVIGGVDFRPTPIFDEIMALVDIDGVAKRYNSN